MVLGRLRGWLLATRASRGRAGQSKTHSGVGGRRGGTVWNSDERGMAAVVSARREGNSGAEEMN
jgi:hypothetical protein